MTRRTQSRRVHRQENAERKEVEEPIPEESTGREKPEEEKQVRHKIDIVSRKLTQTNRQREVQARALQIPVIIT